MSKALLTNLFFSVYTLVLLGVLFYIDWRMATVFTLMAVGEAFRKSIEQREVFAKHMQDIINEGK